MRRSWLMANIDDSLMLWRYRLLRWSRYPILRSLFLPARTDSLKRLKWPSNTKPFSRFCTSKATHSSPLSDHHHRCQQEGKETKRSELKRKEAGGVNTSGSFTSCALHTEFSVARRLCQLGGDEGDKDSARQQKSLVSLEEGLAHRKNCHNERG